MADPVRELRELLEKATPRPWCIESCGEKGDGSNMIGVAFARDDQECKTPLEGWIEDADGIYVDATIADCEHRNGNANADAALIVKAVNHLPALLDRLDRMEEALREIIGFYHPESHATQIARAALAAKEQT